MQLQNKKRSKVKWIFLTLSGVVLIAAGSWLWFYTTSKDDATTPITAQDETIPEDDRTYTEETEGQEVTVPDNVDPSSIKNYTLITENETFKIRELEGEYYITLYAIINRPDQSEMYNDQLRQYKQAALDYLETHNVNVTEVKIHYEPAEAANL